MMLGRWWAKKRLEWAQDELEEAKARLKEVSATMHKFNYPEEKVERLVRPYEQRVRRAAAKLHHVRKQTMRTLTG